MLRVIVILVLNTPSSSLAIFLSLKLRCTLINFKYSVSMGDPESDVKRTLFEGTHKLTRKITFDLDPFRERNTRNYNAVKITVTSLHLRYIRLHD